MTSAPPLSPQRASSEARPLAAWAVPVALLLVTLLAAGLRFYKLGGRSFWLDEIAVWNYSQGSLADVVATVSRVPSLTPAVFILDNLSGHLGQSEAVLRAHAALAGTLCVPVAYLLGRRLYGVRVGLVAALLVAALPFLVWYSQENAAYALFALLTTAQMLAAYQAVCEGRVRDWLALSAVTLLALYTHEIALTSTAAAALFAGCALLARLLRPGDRGPAARQVALAAISGLLAVAGYLPWLNSLLLFRHHQELGLSRFSGSHHAALGEWLALLGVYGFSGLLLFLLGLGLLTAGWRAARGRALAAFLLACWLAVPLAAFVYELRDGLVTIWPRYLIFLVPAAATLAALGVDGLAAAVGGLAARTQAAGGGRAEALVTLVLLAAIAVQLVPAQLASYATPKEDYRAVAERVAAASPPGSVLLALGDYSDWSVLCFGYYFKRLRADVRVMEASQADSDLVARLSRGGAVWGVVIFPSPEQEKRLQEPGAVATQFVDATRALRLVRATGSGAPLDQARALLRWEQPLEPGLGASLALLDLAGGSLPPGPDLLRQSTGWSLPAAGRLTAGVLTLTGASATSEVDAAYHGALSGNDDYAVSFDCRNPSLAGLQKAYALALGGGGETLGVYPSAAGYTCAAASDWQPSYFAFHSPEGMAGVLLLLRVDGRGEAGFRSLRITPLKAAA